LETTRSKSYISSFRLSGLAAEKLLRRSEILFPFSDTY